MSRCQAVLHALLIPSIEFEAICKRLNVRSYISRAHARNLMHVIIELEKQIFLFMRGQEPKYLSLFQHFPLTVQAVTDPQLNIGKELILLH
jgi:hypothetical protein